MAARAQAVDGPCAVSAAPIQAAGDDCMYCYVCDRAGRRMALRPPRGYRVALALALALALPTSGAREFPLSRVGGRVRVRVGVNFAP